MPRCLQLRQHHNAERYQYVPEAVLFSWAVCWNFCGDFRRRLRRLLLVWQCWWKSFVPDGSFFVFSVRSFSLYRSLSSEVDTIYLLSCCLFLSFVRCMSLRTGTEAISSTVSRCSASRTSCPTCRTICCWRSTPMACTFSVWTKRSCCSNTVTRMFTRGGEPDVRYWQSEMLTGSLQG